MKKKVKLGITAGIIVAILVGLFCFEKALLKGNDYKVLGKDGVYVIDKIRKGEKTGETIALTSEEVNDMFFTKLKNGMEKGNLKVKGINVKFYGEEVETKAPVSYKNFDFLITVRGSIKMNGENLEFYPSFIKVGSVKVPMNLVMKKAKEFSIDNVEIGKEKVVINKKVFPFDIKDLYIKEEKLYMTLDKFSMSDIFNKDKTAKDKKSSEKTKNAGKETKNVGKENKNDTKEEETSKSVSDEKSKEDSSKGSVANNDNGVKKEGDESSSSNGNSSNNSGNGDNSSNEANKADKVKALNSVYGELSAAIGYLGDSEERAIVSTMLSTVGAMISNQGDYDYTQDAGNVQGMYSAMSAEKKKHFKEIIYSNVSTSTMREVRAAFGI